MEMALWTGVGRRVRFACRAFVLTPGLVDTTGPYQCGSSVSFGNVSVPWPQKVFKSTCPELVAGVGLLDTF